MLLAPVEPD